MTIMWSQWIVLTTLVTGAAGMCFGVPPYKQSVPCPAPMVYYAPLCVCLQPNDIKSRVEKVGTSRPVTMKSIIRSLPSYTDGLNAQRYRLTASLPDMPGYGFGSSVSSLRQSPLLFSDPTMTFSRLSSNQMPRSWQIIGRPNFWSRAGFIGRDIPTISSAMKLMDMKDKEAIAMVDELKMMRNKWRQRSLSKAKARYASQKYFPRFYPSSSNMMQPDVGSSFPSVAGELVKHIESKKMYGYLPSKTAIFFG